MKNIEKQMQKNSSVIYWQINDIDENLLYITKELPHLNLSREALKEINDIIGEYFRSIDFIRSQSLEICEEFAVFILDPDVTRLKVEEEDIKTRIGEINVVLQDQTSKLNNFISSIADREKEIPEPAPILFYESGTNILKSKESILKASLFIIKNLNKYQYEIKSKNTTSN